MTKQHLIEKVAAKTELKKSEAELAVDSVLAMIAEALQANERVDLRGFGSFVVKDRKERQGRNPRTGETITHRRKTGCGLQAQQGTDGKAGAGRTGSDAGCDRIVPAENSGRAGGGSWLT
jgi:DNA-binding protein HU-beta